jgi:mono/diheme cytochrome c family protein
MRSVDWTYPNRIDCMKCHNQQGGFSLGPETAQLNRLVAGQNQIDALAARGVFETPPAKPYAAALLTPYPDQAGEPPASASVETRIRSYMHANCAFCHRPDSDFPSLDLRYDIPFKDTHLCGSMPLKGDVGVTDAKNLTPGQALRSTAWLRMAARPDEGRMPQIGSARIDELGLKLMGDWISAIASCP